MGKQTLMLLGSGEFTPAMVEPDRYVLGLVAAPRVAILPTAAGQEDDWWKWVDNGISHFSSLGVPAFGLNVRNKTDANNPDIISALDEATVLYISGGDPGYLLSVLSGSRLWRRIQDLYTRGMPLAGSSAGAMILGGHLVSNIYQVIDQGEKQIRWVKALNVISHTIWPHFDYIVREQKEKFDTVMASASETIAGDWLGIDEDTAVIWQGNAAPKVIGKGKAHWGSI